MAVNDNVGTLVIQHMANNGDYPITNEEYQHSDVELAYYGYQWSQTWGTKGRYIASDKSGEWQVFGPFR